MGVLNADYETDSYAYSEYTSGIDYNTIFDVSNHDLHGELLSNKNKFIILEIEFVK